jgi:hypothetical protein
MQNALIPFRSRDKHLERNMNPWGKMSAEVEDAVAGVALLVFLMSALLLSAAGQVLLA